MNAVRLFVDEWPGITQAFVFVPAQSQVIAVLKEAGQDFLKLRQPIGQKGAGQRKIGGFAFNPLRRSGEERGDIKATKGNQARRSQEDEPAGNAGRHRLPL
jgi:hypothetical protein